MWWMYDIPMESKANLCEKDLQVFAAQVLVGRIPDLLKHLAARCARFSVVSGKR